MTKVESVGLVKTFSPNGVGSTIPFIQFADDSLFMVKTEVDIVENLRCILLLMEVATGLKVNCSELTLSSIGEIPRFERLVEVLECDLVSIPITYLGLPLGARSKAVNIWNPVIEKMGRKLSSWKMKYLSSGGRLVLLKNALASMPIHFLSLFEAPKSVTI